MLTLTRPWSPFPALDVPTGVVGHTRTIRTAGNVLGVATSYQDRSADILVHTMRAYQLPDLTLIREAMRTTPTGSAYTNAGRFTVDDAGRMAVILASPMVGSPPFWGSNKTVWEVQSDGSEHLHDVVGLVSYYQGWQEVLLGTDIRAMHVHLVFQGGVLNIIGSGTRISGMGAVADATLDGTPVSWRVLKDGVPTVDIRALGAFNEYFAVIGQFWVGLWQPGQSLTTVQVPGPGAERTGYSMNASIGPDGFLAAKSELTDYDTGKAGNSYVYRVPLTGDGELGAVELVAEGRYEGPEWWEQFSYETGVATTPGTIFGTRWQDDDDGTRRRWVEEYKVPLTRGDDPRGWRDTFVPNSYIDVTDVRAVSALDGRRMVFYENNAATSGLAIVDWAPDAPPPVLAVQERGRTSYFQRVS